MKLWVASCWVDYRSKSMLSGKESFKTTSYTSKSKQIQTKGMEWSQSNSLLPHKGGKAWQNQVLSVVVEGVCSIWELSDQNPREGKSQRRLIWCWGHQVHLEPPASTGNWPGSINDMPRSTRAQQGWIWQCQRLAWVCQQQAWVCQWEAWESWWQAWEHLESL